MEHGLTMADPDRTRPRPSPARVVPVLVAHLVITSFTWRDLRNRADDQVRGNKSVWRLVSALNTLGSLAYWLFGRRPGHAGDVH